MDSAAPHRDARVIGVRDFLDGWMEDVVESWRGYWKDKGDVPPHRYSLDFGAFVGERLMTDFALRHREREARAD